MKEIHKIKFSVFYGAKILSAMYLAYYLFSVVFSLAFGFNFAVVVNVNLVAVALYFYFNSMANKELNEYLKD